VPGPRPKPADRRQRRNAPAKGQAGALPVGDSAGITPLPIPPAARHWAAPIKEQWRELWSHPIAQAIDRVVHLPHARRLFDLRDEREKLAAITRAEPIVEGSTGNTRPHPLFARLGQVESLIAQLEKDIGLSPKAGLDLGMQFSAAKKTLDELASAADADTDEEDDPRIAQTGTKIIEVTATDA
jgi:hypothetical protein